MRQEHTGTLSKYFWRNKTRSLYENAIETCYLLRDYEKAYYFMEKSRAVMLNDKLNELGAKQKLNETDQEKERDFQRKIIELNTKIEAETKATEKEKLNSQLFDLQEQQERFVKSLETKYPAYYQLKYNTQIGTLKQMQAYLKTNFKDKNANMVSYFFGDSASYAMVISPTKAEVKQFKYDVAQNQEFVNFLATNQGTKADFARILSMGSVIYQKLIKPLNIPKGHLIISQDGVFMPFEALSSSAASAQYLLKDYAISYTYSGQFLLKKAVETKFWPNQSFVGFAPVEFNNQLNSLKTSDLTLGNVAKNYWFSNTFTGKVATKAKFLQQAKDHKIVQIFTHAFADSLDTEPKIYFADDALKISELNAEDQFNTQLLVLSACKTGVGKLAKGEGVLSLARGFSMLGIPATITSLWSVEDKNTYQLTELFYIYLNQGLSKDEALQKAKLEFLELHPNAGPTDWACMVLVGQTLQLNNNTPVLLVLSVIFVISIIAGGLYFDRNRRAA
ncbi:CHAT domain-containing protein [Lacihabitans soyangensis]|nr:CHAT domain-containing protein [Lacihabitans soyangensis]